MLIEIKKLRNGYNSVGAGTDAVIGDSLVDEVTVCMSRICIACTKNKGCEPSAPKQNKWGRLWVEGLYSGSEDYCDLMHSKIAVR